MRHQPVALRGAHELAGLHRHAVLVAQPQQHLESGPAGNRIVHRHDRLRVQLEAAVLERRLQLLQPVDLAAAARRRLVARRVDLHVAALLLRHVAGGIRRRDHVLDRAALARDLDEADAHADVEDLVLPDEAVVGHGAHQVVGDLARLVERAARQQDAELVAAEAADGVGVAHRLLEQPGNLAQHAVAGGVATLVVHRLEAVEVEVAEHAAVAIATRLLDGFLETPDELAAVDEPGERVVARLVGHLARQSAQVGHVAHGDHRACQVAGGVAQRRHLELERTLRFALARYDHATPADVHARAGGQALLDRIAERPAVALLHQVEHLGERAANELRRRLAEQRLA